MKEIALRKLVLIVFLTLSSQAMAEKTVTTIIKEKYLEDGTVETRVIKVVSVDGDTKVTIEKDGRERDASISGEAPVVVVNGPNVQLKAKTDIEIDSNAETSPVVSVNGKELIPNADGTYTLKGPDIRISGSSSSTSGPLGRSIDILQDAANSRRRLDSVAPQIRCTQTQSSILNPAGGLRFNCQ